LRKNKGANEPDGWKCT